MVKTKHQKSKPKQNPKSSHIKKQGKAADISEFRKQLDGLGLKIIEVTADGNCFFRALADQLEGDDEQHQKYRTMVVQYIMKNREMFEPFIEDEVPFDDYCQSMEKDGTWAGHMELQAASLVTRCNICIHRHDFPRWYIRNFGNHEVRMIHLSYHDGEHYNSVRSKDDTCAGPARPIFIKADADLSTSNKAKTSSSKSKVEAAGNTVDPRSLKMVMDGTGCVDIEKVKKVIEEVNGDAYTAMEYLIAQQEYEEKIVAHDEVPSSEDVNHGKHPKEESKQQTDSENRIHITERSQSKKSLPSDDKIIPRNKLCPCGSRKKYKSCCGSVAGKSSARLTINKTFDDVTDRKDKKQRKKASQKVMSHDHPVSGQPDLGALCI